MLKVTKNTQPIVGLGLAPAVCAPQRPKRYALGIGFAISGARYRWLLQGKVLKLRFKLEAGVFRPQYNIAAEKHCCGLKIDKILYRIIIPYDRLGERCTRRVQPAKKPLLLIICPEQGIIEWLASTDFFARDIILRAKKLPSPPGKAPASCA